jgi:hypothetical protein
VSVSHALGEYRNHSPVSKRRGTRGCVNCGVTRGGPVGTGTVIAASIPAVALLVNCAKPSSSGPESGFPASTPRFPRSKRRNRFLRFSPVEPRFCFPLFALEQHWNTDTDASSLVTNLLATIYSRPHHSTPTTLILAFTTRLPVQSCPAQKMVQPCFSALNSQPISFGRR